MFVRPCYRKKDGKRHAYWALVESYRTERGPRQRVVAYLGRLDEEGRLGGQQAAAPNAHGDERQQHLPFADETSRNDSADSKPRWVTVNASAVRVENCVQFGGPWLALELLKKIGLDDFLQKHLPFGQAWRWCWLSAACASHRANYISPSTSIATRRWHNCWGFPRRRFSTHDCIAFWTNFCRTKNSWRRF